MRGKKQWYAVRCCCIPTKILGFLRLDENLRSGAILSVADFSRENHPIEIKLIQDMSVDWHKTEGTRGEITRIDELAIYSDDRELNFWKTIPGFIEAKY